MDARDAQEALEETGGRNGRVALLIAALAALLAIVEVSGGNADQDATKSNIDAANLWAFFQAKTIRRSEALNFAEWAELSATDARPERHSAPPQQPRKSFRTTRKTEVDGVEELPPDSDAEKPEVDGEEEGGNET